jgi:hypothetical protein
MHAQKISGVRRREIDAVRDRGQRVTSYAL